MVSISQQEGEDKNEKPTRYGNELPVALLAGC